MLKYVIVVLVAFSAGVLICYMALQSKIETKKSEVVKNEKLNTKVHQVAIHKGDTTIVTTDTTTADTTSMDTTASSKTITNPHYLDVMLWGGATTRSLNPVAAGSFSYDVVGPFLVGGEGGYIWVHNEAFVLVGIGLRF